MLSQFGLADLFVVTLLQLTTNSATIVYRITGFFYMWPILNNFYVKKICKNFTLK